MNSTERFEFDLIRRDQSQVHRLVDDLDRRIAVLARRYEEPAPIVPPPSAEPPPLPPAAAREPSWHEEPSASEAEAPISTPPTSVPSSPAEPLELRVGTYWMARIGIVILLTGLVFLGNYAYHQIVPRLGPWGKLSLLALAGAALGGIGAWMERSRESTRNFGRVLLAGGAATIYYTVYAAHFVDALRVIESPVLGGGLLLALAGGFLWHAERRRSEALALPTVLLAYYTSSINSIGGFTLFSNLLLTAAAVFFLVRHRWTRLSSVSLVATYGSYAFWRFHQVLQTGGAGSEFGMGVTFLAGYWVLFTVAVFLSSREAMRGSERVAFLTANNAAFFAFAAQHFALHRPDSFWMFALGFGGVLLALAALAARVRAEERALDGAYLAQGLALVTLGFAGKLTGPRLAAVFAVESAALLAQVKRRHGWIYEIAAGLCALAAGALTVMELGWHSTSPIALGGPVAALLFFDAWWIKRQRGELASERFSERAFVFAVLGLAVVGAVLWQKVDEAWLPAACALVSVASLAALRVRLREIAFPGQAFLFAGLALFLARTTQTLPSPWWSPLPLIVVALGLMHWWQREQTVKLKTEPQSAIALAFAAAAATAGLCWMRAFCHGDAWLWATSAAALGTLLYGWLTEAWPLAWAGQIFSIVASVSFVGALVDGRPAWAAALAPVVNLALTSALLSRARFVSNDDWLLQRLAQFYHLAAMASAWLWVTRWTDSHGEAEHLTVAWALLALVIFAAGLGLRERLYRAGGFAVLGLAVGRLFVVDVWRFDTLPRIVSFLVLGGVLLALSFVYNRFAEALRRWL